MPKYVIERDMPGAGNLPQICASLVLQPTQPNAQSVGCQGLENQTVSIEPRKGVHRATFATLHSEQPPTMARPRRNQGRRRSWPHGALWWLDGGT